MMPQKQVLIVEDNDLNRAMLSEILSDEYQVLEAENGQVALDILKQHRDNIALILLDVMMPVMDGYTFLDRMKEDEELTLIPVIVMTQSDSEADEVNALSHGATDFVPKPYRPQVILHRVASIIKLRETATIVNQLQYDRLTGLYSKEFFYRKVKERLETDHEHEYTIVCFDIENFKLYNDIYGRKAGDRLLCDSAANMKKMIGELGICGRYGADCFLFMQERETELSDRENFLNESFNERTEKMENVSVKWGIYEITDRTIPVEQMCDWARVAADSIKGQYNQFYAIYDDALRGKMLREKAITDTMETSLAERQFIVYLQPKYNLNEESMAGAEALVRWIHPEWGFMSPGEFIPLFEKNGFISHLDQYVWEQVCMKLRDWKDKGYPLLPVSVNVSRADIYQIDLVDTLAKIIGKYDIDPVYLHLEITESAYAENPVQIINTVNQLRKLGFIIEMDDFGSGYSSLNMLNQMKMDILKLDMKFIQNEMEKPADQSILSYVINMSHGMGLSVVAEGVETREQLERLRDIGCDYVQGYYFAKPMPVTEYEELLKNQPSCCGPSVMTSSWEVNDMRSLLIIDEDEAYRKQVCRTFKGQYQVLEASDSDSALPYITEYERGNVSAVILSMTLPENGAASILKVLRQNPLFWRIPVLATIPGGEMMEELPLALETDDFLCKCHPQCDLQRRVEKLMGIAAAHERELTLKDEASRDYMTGLLNRRGLQAAMDSLRKEDLPVAVCLFDLDDLKQVNDTFGHEEGDRLIQSFADLLRRKTRAKDILCRYGGDEFLVVLKHLNDGLVAEKKASDICQAFQASCSVGIALCGPNEKNFAGLIQNADQALYRAKRKNKGGCCLWKD